MAATTAGRARLAAVPILALLIVAVAVGAAARSSGPGPSKTDEQASIIAVSVLLTLLALAIASFFAVALWHLLDSDKRHGPGKEQVVELRLIHQLIVAFVTLAVLVGLGVLFAHLGHRPASSGPVGGGVSRNTTRLIRGRPLPYSVAAGIWTTACFVLVLAAVVVYPKVRRRLRVRGAKPFADLSGLEAPASVYPGAVALREPLASVTVADPRSEPDPRLAVMAAWTAMTDAIGRHWRAREASEAPQEYLTAALVEAGVRAGAARRLTDLFEVARWGGREVGEEMRAAAIAALDQVHSELAAPAGVGTSP